jgi:hypothetical protein
MRRKVSAIAEGAVGGKMRNTAFVCVALLLGNCQSNTASLDSARSQYADALADYQACMNATSGEASNNCEPKRLIAEAAEQAYKEAMSKGL